MKDARFTELLNLYLDHRLSPSDAAELEAEVARHPERHRIYAGYCRMQRACDVIFDSERARAPHSAALARALSEVERKLATPVPPRRSTAWLGWSGAGAAAAACLVVVSAVVGMRELAVEQTQTVATIGPVAKTPPSKLVPLQAGASQAMATMKAGTVVVEAPVTMASVMRLQPVKGMAASANVDPDALAWSRLAAQRWIDAEAAALVENRLVDDGRFEVVNLRSNNGLPAFKSKQQMQNSSGRGELASYQFQR